MILHKTHFTGHSSCITAVCIHEDDESIFTSSYDFTCKSWYTETGKNKQTFEDFDSYETPEIEKSFFSLNTSRAVSSCILSSDNKYLYCVSYDATIKRFFIDSGQLIQVYQGHTKPVN